LLRPFATGLRGLHDRREIGDVVVVDGRRHGDHEEGDALELGDVAA
jgi:hypothetical protein